MRAWRLSLLLTILLVCASALALLAGQSYISPLGLLDKPALWLIVEQVRAPRIALAIIIGGGLGISGAAMQGYLRNPLADPGLFGISSSASLGAVTALFFGLYTNPLAVPAFALLGAMGGTGLLALLAGRSGSILLFTLGGVMLASLTGALTSLMISLAPSPFAVADIVTWLMGAFTDRSWQDVFIAAPVTMLGCFVLLLAGRALDALTLGEEGARSLGFDMRRLSWMMVIGAGLAVGGGVAVAGIIGFVGLVVPHVLRPIIGGRPSALLFPSALAGALLLVCADTLVRIVPTAGELRLGIIMSLVGAPFFLGLLLHLRREMV